MAIHETQMVFGDIHQTIFNIMKNGIIMMIHTYINLGDESINSGHGLIKIIENFWKTTILLSIRRL